MSTDLAVLRVQMEAQTAAFEKGMENAVRSMKKLEDSGKPLQSMLTGLQGSFLKFNIATQALQTGVGQITSLFSAFRDLGKAREGMLVLQGSLEALLGSSERAGDMLERVYNISGELGVPVETTTDAIKRMSLGLKDLGASNKDIENVTTNFLKIGATGGSVQEASGAIFQFSQALGSGALRGDEMISLLERVPTVAQHIAKYLGTNIGGLRKLGSEGKITSQILFDALNNAGEASEKFAQIPKTVAQNIAQLSVSATKFKVAFAEAFQINEASTAIIQKFAEIADGVFSNLIMFSKDVASEWGNMKQALEDLSTVIGVALIPTVIALGTALRAAALANPFTAIALAATTAAALIISNWKEVKLFILESLRTVYEGLTKFESIYKAITGKDLGITDKILSTTSAIEELKNGVREADQGFGDLKASAQNFTTVSKEQEKAAKDAAAAFKTHREAVMGLSVELIKLYSPEITAGQVRELEYNMKVAQGLPVITRARFDELQALHASIDAKKQLDEWNKKIAESDASEEKRILALEAAIAAKVDKDKEATQAMIEKYDKAGAAAREYQKDLANIDKLFADGSINVTTYFNLLDQLNKPIEKQKDNFESLKDAINGFGKDFTNNFIDGLARGEMKFGDFANSILKTIAKTLLNKQVEKWLGMLTGDGGFLGKGGGAANFLSGLFNAHGNAFSGGTGLPHGVYDSPHLFKFATGGAFGGGGSRLGVLGEAGPEAILPLRRGTSGNLGVAASPTVINVINNAGVEVQVAESNSADGSKQIDVMISKGVRDAFASGSMDKIMKTSYGISRAGM